MFSGNGTIDYSVEAHTLDTHKTSTAYQESTTGNLHGSTASTFHGSTAQNLQVQVPNDSKFSKPEDLTDKTDVRRFSN